MQLDELIAAGRRVVHDFADHRRAEPRAEVGIAQTQGNLQRKLLLADAVDVAAEGNAVGRRVETKPVTVAGQVQVGVAGQEVNVFSAGREAEEVR